MSRIALSLLAVAALSIAAAGFFGVIEPRALHISATGKGATQTAPRRSDAPVRVQVAPVRVQNVPMTLSSIGSVQAYNTVSVRSRVDGEIVKILFEEGQDVEAGAPLAVIDPRPYEARLKQNEAARLRDLARLNGAALDLDRYKTLVQKNISTQQQVDQQQAMVDQLSAQVQADEAQVEFAKTELEYTTIRAPITGRVGIRQVDVGNIVHAADRTTMLVLTQLKPISVIFTVAATSLAQQRLVPGRVGIPAVALAADESTELDHGKVDLVDNQVDPTTGMIKLKASFPNEQLRLWPGDFVHGRLVVETRRDGLTVPSAALRHGPNGDFVWAVQDDKTVRARGVQVVQNTRGRVLLARGVSPGELVVTEGYFLLENGRRVEFEEVDGPGPQARSEPD